MPYKTDKLEEKEGRKVVLDNEEISASDFNSKLEGLKSNQRIIETKKNQFFTVERFYDGKNKPSNGGFFIWLLF